MLNVIFLLNHQYLNDQDPYHLYIIIHLKQKNKILSPFLFKYVFNLINISIILFMFINFKVYHLNFNIL